MILAMYPTYGARRLRESTRSEVVSQHATIQLLSSHKHRRHHSAIMVLYKAGYNPTQDSGDNSTASVAATTPPSSVAADIPTSASTSSIPCPGSTFIIRSTASGRVLTLLDGQVVLAAPGGRGSIHWVCGETKGWLGFQNLASGKFLGHNLKGRLCCSAGRQQGWENFCARMTLGGGYVLLVTHWGELWRVGGYVEQGVEMLDRTRGEGIVWEFVRV